ncbi:MAG: WbqC family protein [Elusimicrobia bacterium]|nr:WbqC family protein [Elusimicrobiota bacterium]MBU2614341.1 WbqC family protein [Elusimicrobiota bacterium]
MIVSVHQPQYIPWIGYFHKIAKSDEFIFLDNVQYKKREFQNRNKILTKNGSIWLTVPVITKEKFYQKISEVAIDNTVRWQEKHWESIKTNYNHSKYFKDYQNSFEAMYAKTWSKLVDLNSEIIFLLLKIFDIKTPVKVESELNITGTSTQRIINICEKLNSDTYLSGAGGKEYMDESLFEKEKIKLIYQDFKHPQYSQAYPGGFEPYMSAIDLLFNCGPDSSKLLRG